MIAPILITGDRRSFEPINLLARLPKRRGIPSGEVAAARQGRHLLQRDDGLIAREI